MPLQLCNRASALIVPLVLAAAPLGAQDAPGSDWLPGDPVALGWSADGLAAVRDYADSIASSALMIVTDGRVVLAHGDTATPMRVHSVRKSLMSALIGIHVAAGRIDTSATLVSLGIDEKTPLTATEKSARVADLLRARSGVYLPAAAETDDMRDARPARGSARPGEQWYYNNWDFNVLGTIFEQRTGMGIFPAFTAAIAKPIGMQDFDPAQHVRYGEEPYSMHRSYAFTMTPRDLARFGHVMLRGGRWNGVQVVPAEWVAASTRVHSDTRRPLGRSGYGFMWWPFTDAASDSSGVPRGGYTASGAGGQKVTVFPSLNTVIVHMVDTRRRPARLVSGAAYDELLRRIVAARSASARRAY